METKINLFNIQAEQIVLGSIILNNDFLDKVDDILKINHFYEPAHQIIYTHILKLNKDDKLVADSITLKVFFDNDELLKTIGGSQYLSNLLGISAGIVEIVDYGKIIRDLFKKRTILNILEKTSLKITGSSNKIRASKIMNELRDNIDSLEDSTGFNYNLLPVKNILTDRLLEIKIAYDNNEIGNKDIIKTGLYEFDKKFVGFPRKELTIIAGRPSMGKTTLSSQIAMNVAKQDLNAIFFSLEMSSKEMANKIISNLNEIDSKRIKANNIYKDEMKTINSNCDLLKDKGLFIDDTCGINCCYINKILKRFKRKNKKIDLIVVDYLQIMKNDYYERNRVREVGVITNGLKEIAKNYDCSVVCLSQLSRGVESREEKRPALNDLRDSGEIEQIADIVIFCYRDVYYEYRKLSKLNWDNEEDKKSYEYLKSKIKSIENECELLVRKNRNGICGDCKVNFKAKYSLVSDLDLKNTLKYSGYKDN